MSRSPWLTKASLPSRCLSFLVTEPFRTFTTATAGLPFCPPPPPISPSVPPPTPPPCLESRSSGGHPEVSRRHPSESLLLLQHCVGCAGSFSFLHKLRGPWVGGHVLQGGVRIAGVFPVLCENHSTFRWGQTAPGRGTAGLGRVHELRSLSGPVVPEHL